MMRRWEGGMLLTAEKYCTFTPYSYCVNNPIMYIDPDGRLANPIYDQEGNFLGTDNRGLQGDAIIMDSKFFQQGMEHELAEGLDLEAVLNLSCDDLG